VLDSESFFLAVILEWRSSIFMGTLMTLRWNTDQSVSVFLRVSVKRNLRCAFFFDAGWWSPEALQRKFSFASDVWSYGMEKEASKFSNKHLTEEPNLKTNRLSPH
jgi:hypothetical protein